MLNTRTPHRTRCLWVLTPLLAALLAACGGGDDDPTATVPTGPMGQVTALASGLIQPGTYSVTGCVATGSTLALQRKLRINADGSLQWLNAANNDAVLFSMLPTSTERERRILYYFQPDNWGLTFIKYDLATGANTAYVVSGATGVRVLYNTSTLEECGAAFTPTLSISNASVAARLGSAVALNGSAGLVAGPVTANGVNFTSVGITTAGAITTQTAEPGSSPVAWGPWLTTAATSAPGYYEEQFTSNATSPATSGTPANPRIAAYLGHPTLRGQQSGAAPGTLTPVGFGITRNTSGSGPAVGLDLLN